MHLFESSLISEGHPDHASVGYSETIWNLCAALFGTLPGISMRFYMLIWVWQCFVFRITKVSVLFLDDILNNYELQNARREALSRWLSVTASEKISKEIQEAKYKVWWTHVQSDLSNLTPVWSISLCYPFLIYMPFWLFSMCFTLCNLTPCLFWQKFLSQCETDETGFTVYVE